jgi:acyl-CoA reductase-like NAD-dependent aldehyde dehydrogenase
MSIEITHTNFVTAADLLAVIEPDVGGRDIHDPATGELVGRAPEHGVAELESAVEALRVTQPSWAALTHAQRSEYLNRAADAVAASAEALAELLSR